MASSNLAPRKFELAKFTPVITACVKLASLSSAPTKEPFSNVARVKVDFDTVRIHYDRAADRPANHWTALGGSRSSPARVCIRASDYVAQTATDGSLCREPLRVAPGPGGDLAHEFPGLAQRSRFRHLCRSSPDGQNVRAYIDLPPRPLNHHRLFVLPEDFSHGIGDFTDGSISFDGGEDVRHEIGTGPGGVFYSLQRILPRLRIAAGTKGA